MIGDLKMRGRPCSICGVGTQTLEDKYCGAACAELARRREHYADLGVKPGHPEYTPHTPKQRSLHRAGMRKRGLL